MTVCARSAWLTLGALTLPLEDVAGGWFCSSLDLGYPDVRDVVSNKPDRDGVDDRTAYMGARVISAEVTALRGAGARMDAVAASFAPFMVPSARPTLHYVLDRPGAAERTIVMRGSGYSWPIAGPDQLDIQMQWTAAEPAALDPVAKTATSWAGSSTSPGRTYPLTFNRIYPPGGGSPTTGQIISLGDLPVRPRLLIYGPITYPTIPFSQAAAVGYVTWSIQFSPALTIGAGQYVEVDTAAKTAYLNGDPTQSVVTSIDWQATTWPVILPAPAAPATVRLIGSSTSGSTQVQAVWHDRYLS